MNKFILAKVVFLSHFVILLKSDLNVQCSEAVFLVVCDPSMNEL